MTERIDNIKLALNETEDSLYEIAERKLGTKPGSFTILKKSLDARKSEIFWVYSIEFSADPHVKETELPKISTSEKIFIIGSGPAGLFAAIRLADRGIRTVIVERGRDVERRTEDTERFFYGDRHLDENSNVQFGEGGAGTFSDGKLFTQTHKGYTKEVLSIFKRFGAPEEVTYLAKPHIGSDNLKIVLVNIRKYLISKGSEFRFGTLFEGIENKGGKISGVRLKNLDTGAVTEESADRVILATGHSARDTFYMLVGSGIYAERKDFAMGVRIEHSQEAISRAQYGKRYKELPPADYKLVSHAGIRPVFTFCNCPGGYVMAASSEKNGVCTNGMSNYSRDGANCNSALLVNIKVEDLSSDSIFAGVELQRETERKAFELAGGDYRAPAEYLGKFLKKNDGSVKVSPTYPAGITFVPLEKYLPKVVTDSLRAALSDFGKKIHGFDAAGALLTGPETRFTSPLKFTRNDNLESVSLSGLYPCGEGGGYSGGITSSAADGLRVADRITEILSQN